MSSALPLLRLLLIEDSESDAALVIRQLEKAEYAIAYERVETTEQLYAALENQIWDIIIADYQLPEFDAPYALTVLQQTGRDIPFIVVSGAVGEEKAVALMRSGACDYLMKDNLTRLAPAVQRELAEAQIRRGRKQSEERLRNSQAQYRYLVELSPGAIFVNRNNRIDFVNPAALELFGASTPEQVLGKTPFEIFHPDFHPIIVERLHRMVELNEPVPLIEEKIIRLDGSIRDVEVAAAPFVDAAGKAIQVILRDITERKQAEKLAHEQSEALRASEERYRALYECSPIAILEEDFSELANEFRRLLHEGASDFNQYLDQHSDARLKLSGFDRIIHINQKCKELFEVSEVDGLRASWLTYFTGETRFLIREAIIALLDGRLRLQYELPNVMINGRRKILEMNLVVVPGYEENLSRVLLSFIDITNLRQAEQEMERFFQYVPDMVCIASVDGHLIRVNQEWTRVLGYTQEELLASPFQELIHPDDRESTSKSLERQHAGHSARRFINRYHSKDGTYRWLDWNASPTNENGLIFAAARDITEHLRTEEDIRSYNQGLEISREVLSNLTGHLEIETILKQAIQGAIELTGLESGMLFQVDPTQALILAAHQNVPGEMVNAFCQQPLRFGEGLCGHAAGEGRACVVWENASHNDLETAAVQTAGIQFEAALPLMIKSRCVGVLCVFARDERRPTQRSLDLLNDLCGPIALAIENAWLYKSAQQDATRAEALARTAARLITSLDLEMLAQTVCEEAVRSLKVQAGNLLLYQESSGGLRLAANYGFPADYRQRYTTLKAETYQQRSEWSAPISQILNLAEYSDLPHARLHLEYQARSVLSVKIVKNDQFIGILSVFSIETPRHFTLDEFELLQGLANQAAQAIDNARLFEQVSAGRKHLILLSQQLVEVQEIERRRLALELHDELGQTLNSIKMSLDMMPLLAPETAHEQLLRAQALVGDLIVRVRRMSLELRPSMLDDMGLLPALRWLFKNVYAQTGVEVAFQYNNLEQRFSPKIEITTYRIVQEALTNVARHAGTKAVQVEMWADEQALNLQVRDQGKGFDVKIVSREKESSGLSGMRERARMIGGDLTIESEPGLGTTLSVQLPLILVL